MIGNESDLAVFKGREQDRELISQEVKGEYSVVVRLRNTSFYTLK